MSMSWIFPGHHTYHCNRLLKKYSPVENKKTELKESFISSFAGDACKVNVCQNGGTCVTVIEKDSFICICSDGFTGDTCNETEIGNVFNNSML